MSMQLYMGDCLEVMSKLPDGCADLVLTSPPYDEMRNYGSGGWSWDFPRIAEQITRLINKGGVLVWNVNDQTKNGKKSASSFKQVIHFQSLGLDLIDTMIWEKTGTSMGSRRLYYPNFEFMFVMGKSPHRVFNAIEDRPNKVVGAQRVGRGSIQLDGNPKKTGSIPINSKPYGKRNNIWKIAPVQGVNKLNHPAPFPVNLAEDHITTWTNSGDVVMDPFLGSGTTGVAAKNLGRSFIGIEREPEYFHTACRRIGALPSCL